MDYHLLLLFSALLQQQLVTILQFIICFERLLHRNKKLKKFKRRVSSSRGIKKERKTPDHKCRNRGDILAGDLFDDTGLFEDEFESLYELLQVKVNESTVPKSLEPRTQLRVLLYWLRHYPRVRDLAERFEISTATASRLITNLLPKLYIQLDEIHWPREWIAHTFEGVSGAIDCTSHFRWRVHPRQADYYRADKHAFFLTAQVVCGLTGELYNVTLGLGHNNDKGMLNLTHMKEFLSDHDLRWLADKGYSYLLLVTPDERKGKEWNDEQKSLRSVIETSIGTVKLWRVAGTTFRGTPELQELAVLCCYQLANINLKMYPIRFQ